MADLASERRSISAMTSDEALAMVQAVRDKRRDGIANSATNRKRKAATKKTSKRLESQIAKLDVDQIMELLAGLDE